MITVATCSATNTTLISDRLRCRATSTNRGSPSSAFLTTEVLCRIPRTMTRLSRSSAIAPRARETNQSWSTASARVLVLDRGDARDVGRGGRRGDSRLQPDGQCRGDRGDPGGGLDDQPLVRLVLRTLLAGPRRRGARPARPPPPPPPPPS